MSVSDGGRAVGYRVGGGVGHGEGSVGHGGRVGLGQGLGGDGVAATVGRGRVSQGGGDTVTGVAETVAGVAETVTGVTDTVSAVYGGRGGDNSVSGDLLSEHGGDTSGGTVQLSLSGLHGVNSLPRVVFSGVDGLSVELGGLVVVFAGGVRGGAHVVGSLNVGVDGGTLDVSGGDGGEGGGGVGYGDRGVSHGQRGGDGVRSRVGYRKTGVTDRQTVSGEARAIMGSQQARGRGCGAGEDGGDNL